MVEQGPRKWLALDANVPLDLAAELDFAHDFREQFQSRGYVLLLAPTAAEEIWLIHRDRFHPQTKLATKALAGLTARWGIHLLELRSHLRPVARGIGRQFADRIIQAGLLPPDEINDGIILAETALAEIPLLVTSDKHLLNMEENALLLALNEGDLSPVHPVHPKALLRALR